MTTTHETPTSISESVGAWNVEVSMYNGVLAYRRTESATYSARLTLFPNGYRVARHWTNGIQTGTPEVFGIPKAVVKKADALANRLTRKLTERGA